ncbi:MAG TPA: ribosome biogenesis GTPase Der [Spirochaetaceae bacterium]|nr:ribosome biogenesis GTPase Der [Spirochaetaceae bacterium]
MVRPRLLLGHRGLGRRRRRGGPAQPKVITGRPGQPATSSGQAADSEGSASAGESFRPSCLRCRRPLEHCLCPSLPAMATRCRVVLLMHPHEFKKRKSNTGILTCLHLANSEYIFAMDMDNHPRVRSLIDDPANYCLVLYPGPAAIDISATDFTASQLPGFNPERRLVLFLVDAVNITPEDEEFARQLRKYSAKLVLVVNKADGPERDAAAWSHAGWGYKDMVFVSAEHGRNIGELEELIVSRLDWSKVESAVDEHVDIRIAIMGKPNVGKSTLLNKLLGEEKSIVCDMPGTTRDVVEGHFERKGRPFTVLDTAGIRRKGKVTENVEYYSVNRAIKTLDRADVVILMIDAVEGLSEQDKKIVKLATDKGRAVVFTLNKWDKMPDVKNTFEASRDKLRFFFGQMAYAPVLQLAARDGVGLDKLLNMCVALFDELNRRIETSRLNKAVHEWVEQNPPPASTAGRFKLRYAVQTAVNPVSFSFFITKPDAIAETYISFLKNKLRSELGFAHIPLDLQIKASRKRFEDLEKKD